MAVYSWLTKNAAIAALEARLSQWSLWTPDELYLYIVESLRHFNGLCEQWNASVAINNADGQWINTGTLAGSPRLRSVTDQYLFNQMCSMLLEPQLSGGAWAGSSQFTLQNLQWALQKRCQEVIQATSCNLGILTNIDATPGVRTGYLLPDTVLEPQRNRFLALVATTEGSAAASVSSIALGSATGIAAGQLVIGAGIQIGTFVTGVIGLVAYLSLPTSDVVLGTVQFFRPVLLTREDALSFQSFDPGYLQRVGYPQSWAIASEPPLSLDVDLAPNTPGYFEMLALNAGPTFAPPAASLLGIPDDWSMVPMYGALADVLGQEAESTDRARAAYCLERYTDMLEMMKESNWLLQTFINGQVSSVTALADMDALAVNWQQSQKNLPAVIEAGMDFIAPIPAFIRGFGAYGYGDNPGGFGGDGYGGATSPIIESGLVVTLVGNAPLLDVTNTYLQVARDDWDCCLNYAHHLASFKLGNDGFASTVPMLKAFYQFCADRNRRWATQGIFAKYLRSEGKKQNEKEPRWEAAMQ